MWGDLDYVSVVAFMVRTKGILWGQLPVMFSKIRPAFILKG